MLVLLSEDLQTPRRGGLLAVGNTQEPLQQGVAMATDLELLDAHVSSMNLAPGTK